ncbi:MAG: efflux RND transporter permease subunit [bacterium]|nr:efflux RND transporter permease subunit [bacterium]
MSLPEASVRRPVTVLMTVLAVAIFGSLASRGLPVELLPDISYPTVTVQIDYPDAAPVTVEQFVTRPVEEAVGVIPGVREMRSVSRSGRSEVILEFEWDQEMDYAALEVREKLGSVQLPRDVEPSRVLRFDPALDPIVRLALSGERPLDELRQLADRWLKQRFEAVGGVAAARVRGGLDPEIVVEADEDRLAALGLTLGDLAEALEAENVNQPGGTLRDFNALYLVRTLHEFDDLEELRRTVVRELPAGRVRLEDVATVRRGHLDREEISRLGGREVVELALHREGSANTVEVAANVRGELESLAAELPADLELTLLSDQSRYIVEAVAQVKSAVLLGGLLAMVVLYFFLRDFSSTVIIALAIPVSVVATFLPMQQAGVSLNIMSLGGLALGIGMLVDSSIVVLEAIDRHRASGTSRRRASVAGAVEVASAVTASILTTVCVFLPIIFVRGVAGELFRDQALTVCFSLLTSLAVALTVIPALAAIDPARRSALDSGAAAEAPPWTVRLGRYRLLPIGDGRSLGSRVWTVLAFLPRFLLLLIWILATSLGAVVERVFYWLTAPLNAGVEGLRRAYPGGLEAALKRRWMVLVAAVILLAGSIFVARRFGTELVGDLSQGEFAFQLHLDEGTPLAITGEAVGNLEAAFVEDPRFQRVFSVIGSLPSTASGRRTLGENLAQVDFVLAAGAGADAQALAVERVRASLDRLPRFEAELLHPAVLAVEPPVAVRLFTDDLELLDRWAAKVKAEIAGLDGVADVGTTAEPGNPEVQIALDRDRASSLGLTAAEVATALRRKIGGEVVGQFREGEERLDIRLRSQEAFRDQASEVENLRLRLPARSQGVGRVTADRPTVVPVSAVARVEVGRGPAAIYRADGARMAEITAKAEAADLGSVLADVRRAIAGLDLPPAVRAEMAGQDRELAVSFTSLRLAAALAVFLVYVVMAAQFESLRHPFIILTAVPLALVGIVAALWLTGHPISVLVLIGSVMLAGIVVNNAIVLVDAINRRRREGEEPLQAVLGAGSERLRPILMTTATTVLALLPMALGLGAGDELRAPLAITVIGGLTAATLLTLVVIPCIYMVMLGGRSTARGAVSEP